MAKRQVRTCPSAVSRVRSQAAQNGRVTEAITPTRAGPPSTSQRSAGGGAALVPGFGGEGEAGAQARQDRLGGDHALAPPAVLGVERHLLDEAQLVAVLDGPGQQVRGLVVVAAGHQDRVDLDRGESGGVSGGEAVEDVLVALAARQVREDVGAQGVEGDVDPVQPGVRQRLCGAGQADAVGGQRQPGARGEGGAALDDGDEAGAQQGARRR
ncbi:hypothetical protein GCM10020000_62670 [Streptomyces olivoverticillatus]